MWDTGVTRIERRRGDRRAGTDRRGVTDRRAPVPAKPAIASQAGKRTRLVPCAPDSAWLNTDQAARHLGIPRRGLYRLLSEGAIRGHRKSGRNRGFILFERAALDTYIRTRRSP
jgi:excisionase family DNA binding protein